MRNTASSSCVGTVNSLHLCLVQSRPLGRAANKADQRVSELQVLIEELQWDMEKIRRRENRLNAHLIEILERVRMCPLRLAFWALTLLHRCSDAYSEVYRNASCHVSQVNSKGYKVCGEASSVCGTITINKRKVGLYI